jgi:hypothetical protein
LRFAQGPARERDAIASEAHDPTAFEHESKQPARLEIAVADPVDGARPRQLALIIAIGFDTEAFENLRSE